MKNTTVQLYEFRFTRERLAKMDKKERDFLLALGHITNDLMAVHRLVLYCSKYPSNSHILRAAGTSQNLVMIRVLIGLMHEAWTFVCRELLNSSLRKLYLPIIEREMPEGKAALDQLKNYFQGSQSRNVTAIRHDFAFHYPSQKWNLDAWEGAADVELAFYVSNQRISSFYELSYAAITRAMLSRIATDPEEALSKIMQETVEVSGWLLTLTHVALAVVVNRYAEDGPVLTRKKHDVPARSWDAAVAPAFVRGRWRPRM